MRLRTRADLEKATRTPSDPFNALHEARLSAWRSALGIVEHPLIDRVRTYSRAIAMAAFGVGLAFAALAAARHSPYLLHIAQDMLGVYVSATALQIGMALAKIKNDWPAIRRFFSGEVFEDLIFRRVDAVFIAAGPVTEK